MTARTARLRLPIDARFFGATELRLPDIAAGLLLLTSAALWLTALPSIDVRRMSDLGLISVLPPQVIASVILLTASVLMLLRREQLNAPLLGIHLVALVVFLYAIPVVVEEVPRSAVAWVHSGFVEYIARTGQVAPDLEARFNWPGFFILAAAVTQLAGLSSAMDLAGWAPVYFNLLFLLPVAQINRALGIDSRLMWIGLWIFELSNWIGQDYFSPQALNYFLYLTILAVVLTWFRVGRPGSERVAALLAGAKRGGRLVARLYALATSDDPGGSGLSRRQQAAVIVGLVIVFAFVTFSHQLTPFFTVSALVSLVLFNRTVLRSVPVLFGVMAIAWVSYGTVPFLQGHVVALLKEVGQLTATLSENVTNRIAGSADHHFVVSLRLAFTLALWALAILGAVIRFLDGRRDLTVLLLAASPIPLVAFQAYGGELVLRLYLFSLPFVVLLVAGIVFGRPTSIPRLATSVVFFGAISLMTVVFFVTRYGNERIDVMTSAQVEAVRTLDRMAPPGSLLVAASNDLPWKFERVEQYSYIPVTDEVLVGDVGAIADIMLNPKYPQSFLILTRSQGAYAEVFTGLPPGDWDRFVADVTSSPKFVRVYQNPDAEILVLSPAARAGS